MCIFPWNNFTVYTVREKNETSVGKAACNLCLYPQYLKLPDGERVAGAPDLSQDKNNDCKLRARKRNTFTFVSLA